LKRQLLLGLQCRQPRRLLFHVGVGTQHARLVGGGADDAVIGAENGIDHVTVEKLRVLWNRYFMFLID
jgi:hypothetical protein